MEAALVAFFATSARSQEQEGGALWQAEGEKEEYGDEGMFTYRSISYPLQEQEGDALWQAEGEEENYGDFPYPETQKRRDLVQELSRFVEIDDEALPFASDLSLQRSLDDARELSTTHLNYPSPNNNPSPIRFSPSPRTRVQWSEQDKANLKEGVRLFGTQFELIFKNFAFSEGLTSKKLKSTYHNSLNKYN